MPDGCRGCRRLNAQLLKAEERATAAQERADAAEQRVRALDETKNAILSALSHELRTPLTSVVGFAHMLKQRDGSLTPEQRAEFVDRLLRNATRLERLLADLLDLDRLKRGILTPIRRATDLGTLVRDVIAAAVHEDRIVTVDADHLIADVDASKVERIVENLVANAIKYTRADTRIWVRARAHPMGVMLIVDDEGDGIAPEARGSIFQAFSRGGGSPTHAPGTGIGLTLVQRFAELHGGRAWVQDREGGGASFRVFLPARIRRPAEVDIREPVAAER